MMIDHLIEQLHTPDPSDRRSALQALYDHACDERVLEAAAYLLTDNDRGVREAASQVLIRCSNESAAALTAVHISSLNIAVRNLAGDALVRMGGAAVSALLPYVDSADKDVRKFAIDLISQLPATPEAVKRVGAHLRDSDQNVVCSAIDAIGSLHADEFLDQILTLYDRAEYVRPEVVNAAAKFQDKPALQFFARALSDEDPVVQLAAAEALSMRKDEGMLKVLLEKLDTVSELAKPVILHSIVILLESSDGHATVPHNLREGLIHMLDDTDPVYVRAAVRGLRFFVDDEVISLLISHAGKSESVDGTISSVLKEFPERTLRLAVATAEQKGDVSPIARIVIPILQNMLDTGTPFENAELVDETAACMARCLSKFDADTKISALGAVAGLSSPGTISVIKAGLDDPESSVRAYALDLAGRMGPQHFEKELDVLRTDHDEEIRFIALSLLRRMKTGYQNQD